MTGIWWLEALAGLVTFVVFNYTRADSRRRWDNLFGPDGYYASQWEAMGLFGHYQASPYPRAFTVGDWAWQLTMPLFGVVGLLLAALALVLHRRTYCDIP